jgi:nucleoside phosphorylase
MLANKQEVRYKINSDVVAMESAVRSLYHVTQYIDLPKAGIQPIAHHHDHHIENDKVAAHREFYHPWSSPSVGS